MMCTCSQEKHRVGLLWTMSALPAALPAAGQVRCWSTAGTHNEHPWNTEMQPNVMESKYMRIIELHCDRKDSLTVCYTGSTCLCPSHSCLSPSPRCLTSRNRTCRPPSPLREKRHDENELLRSLSQWKVLLRRCMWPLTLSPNVLALPVFGFAPSIEAATLKREIKCQKKSERRKDFLNVKYLNVSPGPFHTCSHPSCAHLVDTAVKHQTHCDVLHAHLCDILNIKFIALVAENECVCEWGPCSPGWSCQCSFLGCRSRSLHLCTRLPWTPSVAADNKSNCEQVFFLKLVFKN